LGFLGFDPLNDILFEILATEGFAEASMTFKGESTLRTTRGVQRGCIKGFIPPLLFGTHIS